jgi:hypothetical protein
LNFESVSWVKVQRWNGFPQLENVCRGADLGRQCLGTADQMIFLTNQAVLPSADFADARRFSAEKTPDGSTTA